jgi:putative transposase
MAFRCVLGWWRTLLAEQRCFHDVQALKSVRQGFIPSDEVLSLMEAFRRMTNECISIGLARDSTSLKRLSKLSYHKLAGYDVPSYYRLCAISRAAGILSSMRKSIMRGFPAKSPYAMKPVLISCYGFKVEAGRLMLPLGGRRYAEILLNRYTLDVLSDPGLRVRSFTLSAPTTLSLCISKEVAERECMRAAGVDRNLRNLTYGNSEMVAQYDLNEAVKVAERTRDVVASFKRNDVRIRKKPASKYGRRRANRIRQIIHRSTKHMIRRSVANKEAIILEDIRGIRSMYRRGNRQGRAYRGTMNSWPFAEAQRQIEYKAKWEGVPVIRLTVGETRGTSSLCPRCGERLQGAAREDAQHRRQLWCEKCQRWLDRDVAAVMNQSLKGWVRFAHSKGEAVEAMRGNQTMPVILRVDASKGCLRKQPETRQNPKMECETQASQGGSDRKTL